MDAQLRQIRERDREMIPPNLLRAMLALALGSLALVTFGVVTDMPHAGVPTMGAVVAEAPVAFVREEGGVRIVTEDGATVAKGEDAGFIDAFSVALQRKRSLHGVDPALPIRVVRLEDGRITLIDPETDWRIDPRSFGDVSQAAFARFLPG